MSSMHDPIHPAEVLLEEFLRPFGISQYRLAQAIGVPPRRINETVHGKRSISPDTALRLSRAFGTSDRFWINLRPVTTWTSSLRPTEMSSTRFDRSSPRQRRIGRKFDLDEAWLMSESPHWSEIRHTG
jgi:addiction module HigA family antidote